MAFNPLSLILGTKKPAPEAEPVQTTAEPTAAPEAETPAASQPEPVQTTAEQRRAAWEVRAALITRALGIGKKYGLDNTATMSAWTLHTSGAPWPEGLTDALLDGFEETLAGPAAEPAVNPPDGTPYEEVTTLDQADPVGQAKDPVLPDGRRLVSIKTDEMKAIHKDLLVQAAERGLTADYRKSSALPAKPKRTKLKDDVVLLLDLLGGRAKAPAPQVTAEPEPQVTAEPEPQTCEQEEAKPVQVEAPPEPTPVAVPRTFNADPATLRAGADPDAGPRSLVSVLALDCAGHGTTLDDWRLRDGRPVLRTLTDAVCSQLGVAHYSTPDYRKGERLVVEGLARMLRDGQCEPVDVLILGAGNMARDPGLRELLSQHAAVVVRGVAA